MAEIVEEAMLLIPVSAKLNDLGEVTDPATAQALLSPDARRG